MADSRSMPPNRPRTMSLYESFKRMMDIVGSGIGLVMFSIPMGLMALAIRLQMGRPILYRATRAGIHGNPFVMYKFRTMSNETTDRDGQPLEDAQRLTPVGRRLRETSLDELPGLFNVLRGDMSLVGPRPLLMRYLDRYTPEQARRNDVKPGVTGWAQVNGRNALSWEEKFALDVWYVDNRSLRLDMRILTLTVKQVLSRQGVSADGYATMPEFFGTQSGDPTDDAESAGDA